MPKAVDRVPFQKLDKIRRDKKYEIPEFLKAMPLSTGSWSEFHHRGVPLKYIQIAERLPTKHRKNRPEAAKAGYKIDKEADAKLSSALENSLNENDIAELFGKDQ